MEASEKIDFHPSYEPFTPPFPPPSSNGAFKQTFNAQKKFWYDVCVCRRRREVSVLCQTHWENCHEEARDGKKFFLLLIFTHTCRTSQSHQFDMKTPFQLHLLTAKRDVKNEIWFEFGAKAQRTFSFHSYLSCISARTSTNRGCCGTIWERREEQCHSERLNSLDERTMMIMFMLIDYLKLYFGIWSRTNGTKPVWRKVNNNERINLMK